MSPIVLVMCHTNQANRSFYRRKGPVATRAIWITERTGTHTMRRKTFGHMAFQSGVDVTRIQKLLNHSTPSITLAYIGITQQELDNVHLTLEL